MKVTKETIEKAKTIFIVVVITAGVMFPLGMSYQSSNAKAVEEAVRSAQSTATVETPVKK